MGSSSLILFISLALLCVIGLSALNAMQGEVTSTDANVTSATNTAQMVETPLFTAFGYIALAIICVAVLNSFRSL